MRDKKYSGYEEENYRMYPTKPGFPTVKFTVFFEEGDWAVKTYPNNHIINLTHKHKNGTTYVIPFRYRCLDAGTTLAISGTRTHYGCHVCHKKAPDSVVVVWTLLNWDNWNNP